MIIGTSNGILYPIKLKQWEELKGARRFSEVILSVEVDGKEVMARCLLDTGCTKSMILKKFTDIYLDSSQSPVISECNT